MTMHEAKMLVKITVIHLYLIVCVNKVCFSHYEG